MRLPDIIGRYQRFRRVFAGREGELVLQDILRESGLHLCPFDASNPYQTAFLEGKQYMARWVLKTLRQDPVEVMGREYEQQE